MKKTIKIGFVITIILLMICNFSYASEIGGNIDPDPGLNNIISSLFGVVAYICYGAAVIIVLVKGVQFMAASPEGKAEIKKQIIAVVVGAGILFTIRTILQIIANITRDGLF